MRRSMFEPRVLGPLLSWLPLQCILEHLLQIDLQTGLRNVLQDAAVEDTEGCLVTIAFQMWDAATAASYDNLDMSLDISVAALYFTCSRPTVAALMCFAQDIEFVETPSEGVPEAEGSALEPALSGGSPVKGVLEAAGGATGNAAEGMPSWLPWV